MSRLLFLSPLPIYFDSPEYVRLVLNPSLISALTLGHEPIHPGFILPVWILNRILPIGALYSAELVSCAFSSLGLFVFYKTTKLYFDKQTAIKALIIASLLPVLFLAGVNALTDTTYIFFYLLSFYCASRLVFTEKRNNESKWIFFGILSLGYAVFTHTQVILWLPVYFSPLLFIKTERKRYAKLITLFIAEGVGLGISSLVVVMISAGGNISSSLKVLFVHGSDFISSQDSRLALLRIIRNLSVTLLRNNSSLVVVLSVVSLLVMWRKKRKRKYALFCLIWILPVLITTQYWHIGLFGRVSLVASFPLAILCAQYKSKVVFCILIASLLFITIPLAFGNSSSSVQAQLYILYKQMPKDAVLISSNLIRPQVVYSGETYFINEPGQDSEFIKGKISKALQDKKRVFIDSQALFNPYFSLDGNNLHTLSLGSYTKSEIASVFKDFDIRISKVQDIDNRIFLYEVNRPASLPRVVKGRAKPGEIVPLYSDKFYNRISRLRIDYRDFGTWVWVLLSGRKEPVMWSIADKSGVYEFPGEY